MKVSELREMGLILDISIDASNLSGQERENYRERCNHGAKWMDEHLIVLSGSYDDHTSIVYVIAKFDEEGIKRLKSTKDYTIVEKVKQMAEACRDIKCTNCPYGEGLGCALSKADGLPYTWKFLLD